MQLILLRAVDPLVEIEELVAFEGRGPGTDAERRAARHLERRLAALGREVELESVEVRPAAPPAYAMLALVALAGACWPSPRRPSAWGWLWPRWPASSARPPTGSRSRAASAGAARRRT